MQTGKFYTSKMNFLVNKKELPGKITTLLKCKLCKQKDNRYFITYSSLNLSFCTSAIF